MQDARKTVPIYNVESLARKAGVSRRTIHYYVQRGLLPRPEGGGRGHYYTETHLERIRLIQNWHDQGVPLEKMKEILLRGERHSFAPPGRAATEALVIQHWLRLTVNADVEISFQPGSLTGEDQEAIRSFILARTAK